MFLSPGTSQFTGREKVSVHVSVIQNKEGQHRDRGYYRSPNDNICKSRRLSEGS